MSVGKAAGEVLQPVGAARDEQEVIAFGRKPFGIGYTDARRGARAHGDICLAPYCPSIRHAQRAACLASTVRREWIDYIHNPYPATKFLQAPSPPSPYLRQRVCSGRALSALLQPARSEEHQSELQ